MDINNWVAPARVILDNEVQSSNDSIKIVKLPLANFIHTLYVKVKATNGATSARNLDISDVVDKIEVVANASDVLFSLTPQEIKRWTLWDTGYNISQIRSELPNAVQEAVFPIRFGRADYDPNFYLDCKKFTDLELRVYYSPTIGATAFATGTVTIGVFGLVSVGATPGQYLGTISTKTVRAFTSAASGDEPTLIPRGNLLHSLMVYAYEAAIEAQTDISRVKFDLNNDQIQMFNIAWNDLNDINKHDNWVCHVENIRALLADTNTLDTDVERITHVNSQEQFAIDDAGDEIYFRRPLSWVGDRVTFEGDEIDATAGSELIQADAVARNTMVSVEGEGLSHAVVLDFAKAGESSLLNTSQFDQVRLITTQAGAGADVRISTKEIRSL
jgi:hypothetical protein